MLLSLLGIMFKKAVVWEWLSASPVIAIRPYREESRDRFLTLGERPRSLRAFAGDSDENFGHFVLLCLLTGSRNGAALNMAWNQINFSDGVWRIPRGKNGRPQQIPLVPEALVILQKRRAESTSKFVFSGSNGGPMAIAPFRAAWTELGRRLGEGPAEEELTTWCPCRDRFQVRWVGVCGTGVTEPARQIWPVAPSPRPLT
jgi:integrase